MNLLPKKDFHHQEFHEIIKEKLYEAGLNFSYN